ncbi:MAG: hypothetical protein EBQ92_09600 [Proteobacteria bacterium]|nr:hypothetical protein [Pseudomonadota bacterium]
MTTAVPKKKMCPFCQCEIETQAMTVECSICKIPHHLDCWQESGRCTTYGCNGSAVRAFPSSGAEKRPALSLDFNTLTPPPPPPPPGSFQGNWSSPPPPPPGWSPQNSNYHYQQHRVDVGVAVILAIIFPGAGHFYLGRTERGLAFLFGTVFGWVLFFLPGLAIHIWGIVDASKIASSMQGPPAPPYGGY